MDENQDIPVHQSIKAQNNNGNNDSSDYKKDDNHGDLGCSKYHIKCLMNLHPY